MSFPPQVGASCGADVKSSRRCALHQDGWTDPTDSTGVRRQQHGIRTQDPGDALGQFAYQSSDSETESSQT